MLGELEIILLEIIKKRLEYKNEGSKAKRNNEPN